SGGELQRLALAACIERDADIYLIDEPSSYLDVKERLNTARVIRELSEKYVFVVEHDLVVLDYLSDYAHVIFGQTGAYGIISNIMGVRTGINEYLSGFLKSENMRFRNEIKFEVRPPSSKGNMKVLLEYPEMMKTYDKFKLHISKGVVNTPEVLGILGPNATGKTTFIKMLAGIENPDNAKIEVNVKVSYKPQYIKPSEKTVAELRIKGELIEQFRISHLLESKLTELSGGELQKVAIAECLSQKADMYMLDEPSAYLDVEERLNMAKFLHKFGYDNKTSIMVVDHDILLIDYLSEELLVFEGEGGRNGKTSKPLSMRDGMNRFLSQMNITFRRDQDTNRPRANKPGSQKDKEQRASGEYYYSG
ncbi:MAG: ribosome biogenesis/translation initiation ATPase RLI, partial [Candidatus Altiarchaeota archaeon]|nr:ribosome biogenesis/translation initiation ATPase RLI [Candidatus Altiarchaeota archaeon]